MALGSELRLCVWGTLPGACREHKRWKMWHLPLENWSSSDNNQRDKNNNSAAILWGIKMAGGIRNQEEAQWLWMALIRRDDSHVLHENQPKSKDVGMIFQENHPKWHSGMHLGGRKEPCLPHWTKVHAHLGWSPILEECQGEAYEIGMVSSGYSLLNRAVTQWRHYFIT